MKCLRTFIPLLQKKESTTCKRLKEDAPHRGEDSLLFVEGSLRLECWTSYLVLSRRTDLKIASPQQ